GARATLRRPGPRHIDGSLHIPGANPPARSERRLAECRLGWRRRAGIPAHALSTWLRPWDRRWIQTPAVREAEGRRQRTPAAATIPRQEQSNRLASERKKLSDGTVHPSRLLCKSTESLAPLRENGIHRETVLVLALRNFLGGQPLQAKLQVVRLIVTQL